jgi:hypothetical protein
VNAEVNAEG